MDPAREAVWELKTSELRVFGWFPCIDCFVADAIELKSVLRARRGLVDGYVRQTADARERLGFINGCYINSGEPRHVISNYN